MLKVPLTLYFKVLLLHFLNNGLTLLKEKRLPV